MKDNKDRDEVLAAVKKDGRGLRYVDESFRKDREIVLAAVKQDGYALRYADESFRKDREIVLEALKTNYYALRFADKSFRKDREIVLAVVKQNAGVLEYADKSLLKDKEIVLAAVKQNSYWALEHADESLRKDREFVLAAVKQPLLGSHWALEYADKSLLKDKKIVLAAVKQNGDALKRADKSFRKDKEIVLAAVKQDGGALRWADESLKKDKEIFMVARKHILAWVKRNSDAIMFADKSLLKDKEIVLAALKRNGAAHLPYSLKHADESFRKDREVVMAAVKSNGYALEYADKKLQANKEVVLAAVKQNGDALQYASTSLKKDKEVVKVAIKQSGDALQYADSSLKKDKGIFKTSGEVEIKLKNQLSEQKIIKLSIDLLKVGEIETMGGTYFFEDGTEKEGNSYNNNYLSGNIYFSDIEAENQDLNNWGPFPMKDFIASFMENSWTQFMDESIDNFTGEGKSIDYDYDEFEDYEELDSEGCEWDADDHEPNSITLFFDKSELTLDSDSDAGAYKNNEITFTKKELLNLIKKNQDTTESIDSDLRYFEFKDAHSNKFWELSVAGSTVTARYGKIGTNGQTSVKELDSHEQAQEHARKQAAGKLKKGYQELQKNTGGC